MNTKSILAICLISILSGCGGGGGSNGSGGNIPDANSNEPYESRYLSSLRVSEANGKNYNIISASTNYLSKSVYNFKPYQDNNIINFEFIAAGQKIVVNYERDAKQVSSVVVYDEEMYYSCNSCNVTLDFFNEITGEVKLTFNNQNFANQFHINGSIHGKLSQQPLRYEDIPSLVKSNLKLNGKSWNNFYYFDYYFGPNLDQYNSTNQTVGWLKAMSSGDVFMYTNGYNPMGYDGLLLQNYARGQTYHTKNPDNIIVVNNEKNVIYNLKNLIMQDDIYKINGSLVFPQPISDLVLDDGQQSYLLTSGSVSTELYNAVLVRKFLLYTKQDSYTSYKKIEIHISPNKKALSMLVSDKNNTIYECGELKSNALCTGITVSDDYTILSFDKVKLFSTSGSISLNGQISAFIR